MNSYDLISACRARGISLEVRGSQLRCRAPMGIMTPELKQALADQKVTIMEILTTEGANTRAPGVPADAEVVAIKAWSEILQEAIWVVVDDLPRDEWPTDAQVYQYREVRVLKEVGPDTLSWVHLLKEEFGAQVVTARRPRERNSPDGGLEHT